MDIETVGKDIFDCAYAIHTRFGSGLLEKAYRVILAAELRWLGHKINSKPKLCELCELCARHTIRFHNILQIFAWRLASDDGKRV